MRTTERIRKRRDTRYADEVMTEHRNKCIKVKSSIQNANVG